MKITLLCIGKTDSSNLDAMLSDYTKRINKFIEYKLDCIIPPKNISKLQPLDVKKLEGELILKKIEKSSYLILLDEKGKRYSSINFANQVQKYMNTGCKQLFFVVGGAYGFSESVYKMADGKLSLSDMTTTHQLIRLFFSEQVYRAFTILNGHPYHNE